mmetsp:Transcript_7570/g.17063  ORF Transcript_7570/g.17063 Transcript_7570/m.17063 type:complete len:432 (-) Transcript_7570:2284-3579(-)|eukprot:CAMPEP_0168180122 /NCGR_PEP_ID=MMETSP0139_2-20121125/10304_1 /TAXON_ID=44445 /ORGANISM="Pseudo-nitzschia australis, Strain 10249 10 AB" /LENGTH=431 /DNA_ID=CAMNT_0008100189 /DNA_START=45 /DNA_END=1340 /DNA_ORIENTATION=+
MAMNQNRPLQIARRLLWSGTRNRADYYASRRCVATISASFSRQQQQQRRRQQQQLVPLYQQVNHRRCFSKTTFNNNNNNDYFSDFNEFDDEGFSASRQKTALVVGSSGSLGRCLIKHLAKDLGVRVIGADVVPPREKDESYLTGGFVELPTIQTSETTTEPAALSDLTMALTDGLHQLLLGEEHEQAELDAVVCVAGAWEGDPPPPLLPVFDQNEEFEDGNGDGSGDGDAKEHARRLWLAEGAQAYAENIERMMGKNLYPVLAAGYASQHFMTDGNRQSQDEYGEFDPSDENNDGGLFVAIGATVALGGTPGMLGYGLSKVATHHYLQTLGESTSKAVTSKSKRKLTRGLRLESKYLNKLSVLGILPTTIDTHANREAMPGADFNQWTKSIDLAKEIGLWLREPALRPHSGSLIKVHPKKNGNGAEFRVVR